MGRHWNRLPGEGVVTILEVFKKRVGVALRDLVQSHSLLSYHSYLEEETDLYTHLHHTGTEVYMRMGRVGSRPLYSVWNRTEVEPSLGQEDKLSSEQHTVPGLLSFANGQLRFDHQLPLHYLTFHFY